MSEFVVEIENLTKSFGKNKVLDGTGLRIKEGESYVVIGCSGTGKSVLVKCILGLLKPDYGDIKLFGESVNKLSSGEFSKKLLQCGVLFQEGALLDSLNVVDNVSFGLVHGLGMSSKKARSIAIEKLMAVNLDPKIATMFPASLSGGMKKRVAFARAIATNPKIIFFDEPTTGLDPITSGIINNLIIKCTTELGIAALSITHDMNSLRHISNRVGLLCKGKIIWEGTKQEMDSTSDPAVVQFINGLPHGPFCTQVNPLDY